MKVKAFIKQLKKLNQDATVFISSDAEGNRYGLLSEIHDEGGNLAFNGKTDDAYVDFGVLKDDGSEDPVYKRPAVILYPT